MKGSHDERGKMATATAERAVERVAFGKIELPKFNEPQDDNHVPQPEDYVDPHGYSEQVAYAWARGWDVLLLGETGVGKTSLIRWMCERLWRAYRRFPCHEATDVNALLGKMMLDKEGTYFQEGIAYDAVKKGHVLLADEYNSAHPDVRMVLNPLHRVDEGQLIVAENAGEIVPRHPDFLFVATGNPHSYSGVKEWNPAILSRFDMVIHMDYLPRDDEMELLKRQVRLLGDTKAANFTDAVRSVRAAKKDQRIRYPVSYRELRNWAIASKSFGIGRAAEFTIIAKCDEDDQAPVRELLKAQFDSASWSGS